MHFPRFLMVIVCCAGLLGLWTSHVRAAVPRNFSIYPAEVRKDTVIAPVTENAGHHESRAGKMSGLAIVGFVLAILVPPVGIVISAIALHHVRKNHMRGRDLALAGIIVGASIIGAYLIALAVYGLLWLMFFQFL